MTRFTRCFLSTLLALFAAPCLLAQSRIIDDMSDPSRWRIIVPEGVRLTLHQDEGGGADAKSLRLDYEFVTGGGYCLMQRELPMRMPANYEFAFGVRGVGKENNLEFKLLDAAPAAGKLSDASEHSVWWVNRRSFQWPSEWTRVSNKKRKFEFAWGSSGGAPLEAISKVEFAIASSAGGKGSVWLDELTFRELPTPRTDDGGEPEQQSTLTKNEGGLDSFVYDFGRIREFGGVDLVATNVGEAWLETSDDGAAWMKSQAAPGMIATEVEGQQRVLFVTPDAEARLVRVSIRSQNTAAGSPNVRSVRFRDAAFSASPNSVVMALAKEAPRGTYPKQFLSEASYWTVIGTPDSDDEALINEEGQIEVGKRMFSIEPFLKVDGKLLTWAECDQITQAVQNAAQARMGGLPFPSVARDHGSLTLGVSAIAITIDGQPWLLCGYGVEVDEGTPSPANGALELILAIRPYQVNPPWQRLNFEGGVAPITKVAALADLNAGRAMRVTTDRGTRDLLVVEDDTDKLGGSLADVDLSALDSDRLAGLQGGVIRAPVSMRGARSKQWFVLIPLEVNGSDLQRAAFWTKFDDDSHEAQRDTIDTEMARWKEMLGRTSIKVPDADAWLADTFRAQIAYILINRDGPAFQPGSRSYERSWARDGSMTSSAMLELGFKDEVRAWIDWFGDHIFENGKVPCVVDKRGPDPVPEHDSHGQYIWAVANYYRFTSDRAFLDHHWPKVQKVVAYIQSLRAERSTDEYKMADGLKRAKFGLVPESISHEGYSAKPMHSYWDCFFVLLGLKQAAFLAKELGDDRREQEYAKEALDFRSKFMDSIQRTVAFHTINYIPGCVELGDFDSTSTTIALFPCDEGEHVPKDLLLATFERYWQFFKDRRDGTGPFAQKTYDAYTPYELRHINTFVRLGWRERAHELLAYFRKDQRPQGWHHWAEVVWNDPTTPRFIGDMPHTWCGSDFLNSILAIFAYPETVTIAANPAEQLTCFAGVSQAWIDSAQTIGINDLHTPWGQLSLTMQRDGSVINAKVTGTIKPPPGGLILKRPPAALGDDIIVREVPATVTWQLPK